MAKQCESVQNGVRCAYPDGHSYRHANGLTTWENETSPKLQTNFEDWMREFHLLQQARRV